MSLLSFKDIAKIFEEIELKLIASLKRNLHRHKAWEKDEGFQWSAWQAEKLRNLNKFRQENLEIMNDYVDVIDDETRQLMEEQFHEGEKLAEEIVEDTVPSRVTDNHFFGINERKMDALMEDVTTIEKKAETAALRMVDDVYRQTVNKVQLEMATGSTTLTKAIDDAVSDFLDKGINCIVYKDGKRVNVADYVRMVLRTASARATLQGEAKRRTELGFDTVLVSQYGMCSETCLPWQGQVYIDDVFTEWRGERVGDRGKSNYCGKWFTLLSVAISNGLFHPNCRHTMSTYIDGVTQIPKPIDEKLIKKQRELEQKQRALEKKVRKFKRLEAGTQSPETAKAYRKELRKAQHELKVFVDEHNDILRRDYSREKNYGKFVDKTGGSGIINKKVSDRIYNIHNESDNGVFDMETIEKNMLSSPVGRYTAKYIESEGLSIEMNYDINQPDDVDGIIFGKQISVNAAHHIDETHIVETIIHETAHRQFSWDETQEGEINCRIYEYLHSHEEISDNKIQEIVDFVKLKYSEYPKGEFYGY